MNEQQRRNLIREQALYRYSSALECSDLDALLAVLQEAEEDATLEQMILEVNEIYRVEIDEAIQADDVILVQCIVEDALPSGMPMNIEQEIPPLTVSDVITRVQTDAAARGQISREVAQVKQLVQANQTPLPDDLSQRSVARLLTQLGVSASRQFQKLFRDTAIFLSIGREQGMARLAATRRQQQSQQRGEEDQEQ